MANRRAQQSRILSVALAGSMAFAALWHADDIHQIASDWLGDSRGHASAESLNSQSTAAYRAATAASVPPTFSLEQSWTSPVSAARIAIGDLNGDGRDDLAAVVSESWAQPAQLYMFLQQPNGALAAPTIFDFPMELYPTAVTGLTAVDLNEDGRSDLVVAQREFAGLHYLLSQAGGDFSWRVDDWSNLVAAGEAHVGDLDGDGHVDVVLQQHTPYPDDLTRYSAQTATYFGDGLGAFPRHGSEASLDFPFATALGQLSADRRPDFLSTVSYNSFPLDVRINDGSGGWLPKYSLGNGSEESIRGLIVADLTGDARQDAVVVSNTIPGKIAVFPQLADGSLADDALVYPAGAYSQFVRSADLNGDGRPDLVHLNESESVAQFFYYLPDQYGLGNPIAHVFDVGDNAQQFIALDLAIGDLNGDGVKDVAVATEYQGLIASTGKLTPFAGSGGLPGAPTLQQIQVLPKDGSLRQVDVTVGAPADDGGSAITGYIVYAVPGDVVDADAGSPAAVHRIIGLGDNRAYRFYARAKNAAGLGPPSTISEPMQLGKPVDPGSDPVLQVFLSELQEGDLGSNIWQLQFYLDKPAPPGGASFDVSTSDGTATAGLDYVSKSSPGVSFAAGSVNSEPLRIEVLGDQIVEGIEVFNLDISNPQNLTVESPQLEVVIRDDDDAGPHVAIGGAVVVEGDSGLKLVTIPVKLSEPVANDVTFDLSTWELGATPGVDYESLRLTGLRIAAGQTSVPVQITVHGDTQFEYDELVIVFMENVAGAQAGKTTSAVTILNDDPLPTLSVADISVVEGDQFSPPARFRASLSSSLPYDVNFAATTIDGSAKAGSDYIARYVGSLYIPAGQTSVDIDVPIVPDTQLEPGETFSLKLENPWKVVIGDAIGVATIINDDAPNGLAVDDLIVAEGGAAEFTIRLSEPSAQPVTFNAWTTPGTAVADLDYQTNQASGLTIPAGSTSVKFSVPTLQDTLVEDNETFVLNLGNVVGAQLTDAQGLARIINNDVAVLSIGDVSVVEGNDGTTVALFEVRLSQPMTVPVVFDIAAAESGSAELGSDYATLWGYRVRLDPGRTRHVFQAYVYGDTDVEANETFDIKVTGVKGAVLGDGIGVGTIIDDDGAGVRGGRGVAQKQQKGFSTKPNH